MEKLELLRQKVQASLAASTDPAHDFSHVMRVYSMADHLCKKEGGDPDIVLPAALLHDLYHVPKNHPDRAKASEISAVMAEKLLREIDYTKEKIPHIMDAIRSHSFSRGETPLTKEAMIVQDADRLDAIGAIGIARLWVTGAQFNRALYCAEDPFAEKGRKLDDMKYGLDHFYEKLLKLKDKMNTETAKKIAEE
ncbi:HD domain-containing protein, partial [Candidatus Woesearchaeota archaeon]|nr:HD domain-containing protein [Candidatus Woesearchaeota archaeon]